MSLDGRRSSRTLYAIFTTIALASLAGVAGIVGFAPDANRPALLAEITKGLLQIFAVGVIGTLAKFVLDEHQNRRREALDGQIRAERDAADARLRAQHQREQLAAFRVDKIRRLVQVTNTMRRAPILIDAHRTAKTYNEQMREIVDAGLELRLLRHEIDAAGPGGNPAFPEWPEIREMFSRQGGMEQYIAWIHGEFRQHSKRLSELQVAAERDRSRQADVWDEIRKLPSVRDLLEDVDDGGRGTRFASEYLKSYETAMQRMVRAALPRPI
jgi:hypothetical protein